MSRAKRPNIVAVEPVRGCLLRVRWRDHGEDAVDLSELIAARRALATLKKPKIFAKARPGEHGWTVRWGVDLELDSDHLYRLARYQAKDSLRPEAFRNWRAKHGLSQAKAADALGVSDRMVKYYEDGSHMIPKTVMLACRGYDALRSAA
jgi:DNA-binding XRE family transcriptional regulator